MSQSAAAVLPSQATANAALPTTEMGVFNPVARAYDDPKYVHVHDRLKITSSGVFCSKVLTELKAVKLALAAHRYLALESFEVELVASHPATKYSVCYAGFTHDENLSVSGKDHVELIVSCLSHVVLSSTGLSGGSQRQKLTPPQGCSKQITPAPSDGAVPSFLLAALSDSDLPSFVKYHAIFVQRGATMYAGDGTGF